MSTRILLADDHPILRRGIRALLATETTFDLVGEAADGDETLRLCQAELPDILLLDMHMPGPPASTLLTQLRLRCPTVKILILSAYDDDAFVVAALAAGVAGYILKEDVAENIIQAIQTALTGGMWFSAGIRAKLTPELSSSTASTPDLNEQERTILHLMAQGMDNTQIATVLSLTKQTVKNYVSHIYSALDVPNRVAAILWYNEHEPPEQIGTT
jgi:DNA-binding NarL/FixJ family response regulator